MKKNIKYIMLILICFFLSNIKVKSQQVNTLYFMDNVPVRHYLNPAFQPYSNFYLGLPILGYSQFGFGNNSLSLKDFIYNKNGQTISFLHPTGSLDKFYNAFRPTTLIGGDMQLNLLDFGFRVRSTYWSFALTEKIEGKLAVPQDFMKLMLYGTPQLDNNVYNLTTLGLNVSAYTEAALGFSQNINEKFSVGAKLKFLFGSFNSSMSNQNLMLNAGIEEWTLKGSGQINYAGPIDLNGNSILTFDPIMPNSAQSFVKPAGTGVGIDLGGTYKPISNLTLSAAITDLGYIRWTGNAKNVGYKVDYKFTGLDSIGINNNLDMKFLSDSLVDGMKNSFNDSITGNSFITRTSPKLNVGVEYAFFDDKLSLGLLSRTTFQNKTVYEELTASINGRPIDWFNMSLSYSIMNGRMSTIGAGLGVRVGFINWFVTADYIPLEYSPFRLNQIDAQMPNISIPIAYNTKGMNLALGANIVFGNRHDKDKDGVVDRKDKCPETPYGVIVDVDGCPVDTDGDGIPDYLDKCAKTPPEAYSRIDQNGCPVDVDGDSVPDYLDKCPNTLFEAIGFVDEFGCDLDTDKDSVPDYLDKCPDTPIRVKVDSVGCPLDTDGDGVADYIDLCPATPVEARGMINKSGCPLDTDEDGVFDYLDKCPNTPIEGVKFVDINGCLLDSDRDSVPDYLDKCPNTPAEAIGFVDKFGCLLDSDGDMVFDYLDKCPNTPIEGVKFVDINGCLLDSDRDSVPDYLDKCPKTPAEAIGFVDKFGCPLDSDGDMVFDYMDKCPKVPGSVTNKGCPEIKKEIRTLFQKALQGIQFESGKDIIRVSSFGILNQIAKVLIDNPTYLVEIRGHTDNVGKVDMNRSLSERRALSVKNYLIGKGVPEKRMTSAGFGDTLPVATNKTTAGRSLNRRVEFVVTFEETTYE